MTGSERTAQPTGYDQQIDGCFGADGLSPVDYKAALAATATGLAHLKDRFADGSLPLLRLVDRRDDLNAIAQAASFARSLDTVLVLGTGGSSLGGKTLVALAAPRRAGPRLMFVETVDPAVLDPVLAACDPARTGLLIISKSGGTLETLTQAAIFVPWLAAGGAPARRMLVLTEPGDNPLRRLAGTLGAPILDHDPGIGGRYAGLSNVGLLPASIAGLDIDAVRDGAAAVLHRTLTAATPADAPPAVGAALAFGLASTCPISVMMPYLDRLTEFAMWYRQLWAESLGKGGRGTTPVRAVGPVDQHSQLQLYLDGPRDKSFTLVVGRPAGRGATIGGDPPDHLAGRTAGDVLAALQEATIDTLVESGRPVRVIRLASPRDGAPFHDGLDAYTIGALMMHFMLETILAADLFGVDPFDQPAVEDGKVKARAYLGDVGRLAAKAGG